MSETLFSEHGPIDRSSMPEAGYPLIDNSRFAFLMALAVDVMLFSGLAGGYFVLRGSAMYWPPLDLPHLNNALVGVSCISLAITSGFLWLAVQAQHNNELVRMRVALVSAFVFVAVFLGLNVVEWSHLLADGLRIRTVFGGIYFVITGAFHLHILGGLAYMLMKIKQAFRWRRYTRSSYSITHLSYYFLTMLVVWISIYGVIYL